MKCSCYMNTLSKNYHTDPHTHTSCAHTHTHTNNNNTVYTYSMCNGEIVLHCKTGLCCNALWYASSVYWSVFWQCRDVIMCVSPYRGLVYTCSRSPQTCCNMLDISQTSAVPCVWTMGSRSWERERGKRKVTGRDGRVRGRDGREDEQGWRTRGWKEGREGSGGWERERKGEGGRMWVNEWTMLVVSYTHFLSNLENFEMNQLPSFRLYGISRPSSTSPPLSSSTPTLGGRRKNNEWIKKRSTVEKMKN